MLAAFLAALVASRVAFAVDEVEPNDPYPYTSAQPVTVDSTGTVTVTNASIYSTTTHRDVDFYSFHASAGDVITTYINGGMDANFNGILSVLAVWGPLPVASNAVPLIVQTGSDTGAPPPGSVSTADASITGFHIQTDGTYIVGVSTDPGEFVDISTLQSGTLVSWSPLAYVTGSYSLVITGVTPYTAPAPTPTPTPTPPPPPPAPVATVLSVSIDIMPGRRNVIWLQTANASQTTSDSDVDRGRELARELHRHLKGGIPVALLSTDTFNAMDVNLSSLKFGSTGTESSLIKCNPHGVDVSHDGRPDLLCHFDVSKANFQPGDQNGTLTGTTNAGDAFAGTAYLKVVTGKRDWKKDLDGDHDGHRHHH